MQPQIRSAALQGFLKFCKSIELDPISMMRAEGIDPTSINDPDRRIPVEALHRLLEHLARVANAPDLGLRLVASRPFSILGPLAVAARDEPTVRGAFFVLMSHLYLHYEGIQVHMDESNGLATINIISKVSKPVSSPVAVEMSAAAAVKNLRAFLGESWAPVRVLFEHDEPCDLQPYRRYFGCPVEFKQHGTALHLRSSDLDLPNRMSDVGLASYGRQFLRELVESTDINLSDRVCQLIRLELSSGRCSAERVAQSMGMSRRTLHRQLADLHTSYTELFASVRGELVQRHVNNGTRSLNEIAKVLGYSEPSAFSRWYRKQYGLTPRAGREQAKAQAPSR